MEYKVSFDEFYLKHTKADGCPMAMFNGLASIVASDPDNAVTLAWEDFKAQDWSDVKVDWSTDDCCDDPTDPDIHVFTFPFEMKGKHGTYTGTTEVTSYDESEAREGVLRSLTEKGGIYIPDDSATITSLDRMGFDVK